MLRIKEISIQSIGPIMNLNLEFNDGMNIICGANGIGKTTILECIAQSFTYEGYTLKHNKFSKKGEFEIVCDNNGKLERLITHIRGTRPYDKEENQFAGNEFSKDVIVFKTNRHLEYINVDAVRKDPIYNNTFDLSRMTLSGSKYKETKSWFINRFLWSKHENTLSPEQRSNYDLAIKVINSMAVGYSFSRVDHETNDIMLNTPSGEIVIEQLSEGLMAYIVVLLGLIKEIEYRFKTPRIFVQNFDGILLIDELDVHLHPSMQAKLYSILHEILPKAQIFTSTHSPHVIQVAKPHELIPLIRDDKGELRVNEVANREFGCQGWTIEEILTDVMGMSDLRHQLYKEELEKFNKAIDEENIEESERAFELLSKMLHPNNVVLQVLNVQRIKNLNND